MLKKRAGVGTHGIRQKIEELNRVDLVDESQSLPSAHIVFEQYQLHWPHCVKFVEIQACDGDHVVSIRYKHIDEWTLHRMLRCIYYMGEDYHI